MRRLFLVCCGALLALAVAPAFAGGWAVTTLDRLPDRFEAGQEYQIGYTIRQHGVEPMHQASPSIILRSASGDQVMTFRGTPSGQPGHYISKVHFPSAGEWSWRVEHMLGRQELGSLNVAAPAPAPVAAAAPVVVPAPEQSLLGIVVALGTAAVLAVFLAGWRPLTGRVR